MRGFKEDDRPHRGAWAPGTYCCSCASCGDKFMGDKRAVSCADCAYAPPKPAQHTAHIVDWLLWNFRLRMSVRPESIVNVNTP